MNEVADTYTFVMIIIFSPWY